MKNCLFFFILFILFTGCNLNMQKKYNALISSTPSDINEIVKDITEFEIENPNHFESKIFLAEYYFACADYDNAENYLKRAELVKKHASRASKNESYAELYTFKARIDFLKKNYESAILNANNAAKYDKLNTYGLDYLIGHCYVATEKEDEAIKYFDIAYKKDPARASENDMRAYMYLLNDTDRIEECKVIMNNFLATGKWFYGLGAFCSNVYEKSGDVQESLFYAFMDYEYISSIFKPDDVKFVENLMNVKAVLEANGQFEKAEPAYNLILGLYTNVSNYSGNITSCFISDYLIIRHKIMAKEVSEVDLNVLLGMEKYFSSFPVYYWSIWETVCLLDESSSKNFLPVLKKVIALSPSSVYSDKARKEISRVFDVKVDTNTDLDLLLFN